MKIFAYIWSAIIWMAMGVLVVAAVMSTRDLGLTANALTALFWIALILALGFVATIAPYVEALRS